MHFNHIISLFWRTSSPRFSTSWLCDWLNYWCKIWENHSRNKPQRVEGGEVDKKKTKWQGHRSIVKWNFSKSLSSKNISFTFNRLTLKLLAYNSLTNCPMRMKDNSSEAATLECHCLYQKDKAFRCTERAFGVTYRKLQDEALAVKSHVPACLHDAKGKATKAGEVRGPLVNLCLCYK